MSTKKEEKVLTYPNTFSNLQLGKLKLRNRVALAPMTRTSATEEGLATEKIARYYANFARGGFSLIITEGLYPDESYSQGYLNQPGIANEAHIKAWKKVVNAVHDEGGYIFAQLMHAGGLSQGNRYKNEKIAPSSIKPKGEQLGIYRGNGEFAIPREITKEGIKEVIHGFSAAAVRAREAGFDGIEVHGANGYILDQFLTDYTNQRTDEYGGSTVNRVRLLVEVLQAIRYSVGQNFQVGIRISQGKVNDFDYKWAGGESDAKIIFGKLSQAGADFIHVTEHDATQPAFEKGPTLATLAKKYGRLPVIANGNLEDPNKAEEILKKGEVDIIALGKGALANSDWPNRVVNGCSLKPFNPEILQPYATIKAEEL